MPTPARTAGQRTRAFAGIGAAGALLTLATACGGDSAATMTSAPEPDPVVLTKTQTQAALLTADSLGKGYTAKKSSTKDDADDPGLGCLTKASKPLEDSESVAESEASYQRGTLGIPTVETSVASFDGTEPIAAAFEDFATAMESCTRLKVEADGIRLELGIMADNVRSTSDVSDQVNVRATGTMAVKQGSAPFGIWMAVARVGNNAVMVMVTDVDAASAALLDRYTSTAVDRLVAVTAGEKPGSK